MIGLLGGTNLVEDARLVEQARNGDGDAFGELVRRHQAAVVAVAWSLLGDAAEAEDLAQETFVRALRNLDMLADPARFAGWIRRIAFGTCIDWLRSFRPELYRGNGRALRLEDVAAREPGPLEQLLRIELRERVRDAVQELPPRYRAPLTMYHLDGLSFDKVAAALGVSAGTARSLVTRARRRLGPLLASLQPAHADTAAEPDLFREQRAPARLLHVVNGDSTAEPLRQSGVPGTVTVWADVLHDGPVRPDSGTPEWRRERARFIAAGGWATEAEARQIYEGWDRALDSYQEFDEVVIWLEHDLFDQLLLIRHLDWFAARAPLATRLALICIGKYPGIEPFHGLGQLNPDQLASLLGTRQRVTTRQLELGRIAWRAFTGPDPRNLAALRETAATALPFLPGAIDRLHQELPYTTNGLSRSELQILASLRSAPLPLGDLFVACQKLEERVFMGDTSFFLRLRDLARARTPLLDLVIHDSDRPFPRGTASITDAGTAVLDGADAIRLNGIDRWIGGVQLHGSESPWRWDPQARTPFAAR